MKATPKRKVRIVKRRLPPRGAIVSLAIALGASATVFLTWRVFRPVSPATPYVRTLQDVLLPHRCERGHEFNAPGQVGPIACPTCQTPAYAQTTFECPIHGARTVEVDYALTTDGAEEVSRLRLLGGEWSSAQGGLRCPNCRSPLVRPRHEDISRLGQQRPKVKPGERPPPKETPVTGERRGPPPP